MMIIIIMMMMMMKMKMMMGFNGIQVAKSAQRTWLTVGLNRGI